MKTHEPVRKSKGEKDMKYILMMNCPKTGYEQFSAWQKTDIQAHIAFTKNLDKSLRESGELVSAEGLADPKEAKIVRAGEDGAPVTDGMFPRPKSFSPLLDRRCRDARASLCDRRARIDGSMTWWRSVQHFRLKCGR